MRRGGRVRSLSFVSFISRAIYVYASIVVTESADYGVPIEIKRWDTGRTPLAHMVDVTNEFGLKVLAEHNFLNDNNIAFSPYGLMGILVALYEGVDGESSYQLQRGIQLPWNRNVMRIGFRDIHRTLKTYFVPEEGFLAGLALNNENVTFNDSYKKILRFYGFDLDNDQLPTFPPQANNTANTTTTTAPTNDATSVPTTATSTITTVSMTTETKPREETTPSPTNSESTTNPNAETINPGSSTTASPSSAPNAESTTTTTSVITTTIPPTSRESTPTETSSTPLMTTGPTSTEKQNVLSTTETTTIRTTLPNIQATTDTTRETSPEMSTSSEAATVNDVDSPTMDDITSSTVISTTTDVTTTSVFSTSVTSTETTTNTMSTNSETEQTATILTDMTTSTEASTITADNTTLETLERRKKSIVDFIFTNPPYVYDYLAYRSFDIPAELQTNFDDKMFLANGLKSVQVTYMHYDTVLEHAYLPHLEASALRLPLDSERYYLLVVLPVRRGPAELGRLLSRMARESDLSDIYAALRPRRVRGSVPSFIVKGHVTLTTDLQKLGIRNVFEPRQRDFVLMTSQAGVYVRSIEQAVSVAIRKYRPDDHKRNRYAINREPIKFFATYPFLYFVMDASIHVSLMAGKMVDPLNTRIL